MPNFFVHETAVVDQGAIIGDNSKIWHFCHIMKGAKLGTGCKLGQNVFVGEGVRLGNNVKIQNNVSVYAGVVCEDDVFLGPSMVFTNIRNPRSAVVRLGQYDETYLERGVSVGANVTIVCGVRLGAFCFIGAGAVVTHDVPPYALLVGNPARQQGWMSEYGHRLKFDAEAKAVCPESGEIYQLEANAVRKIS